MAQIKLEIINRSGNKLRAYIDLPPDQKAHEYVLFAHCFTCHSNLNAVRNIARGLNQQGLGVVRFDFTGLGHSQGELAESHFSANLNDLEDVFNHISKLYKAPKILVGHSLGGAAVLAVASRLVQVDAIATIGAPSEINHVKQHFEGQVDTNNQNELTQVNIGGRPFKINQEFVDDFDQIDLLEVVGQLKKPLLIMHSPFDQVVDINHAKELYKKAFHPKSFISLDSADHLLTNKRDSHFVGQMIGLWSSRYTTPKTQTVLSTDESQIVGHLNLVEDGFTTTLQTANHRWTADEPISVGGADLGPSPYELLIGGLAACTTMTLKMYVNRKKWDLKEVYVYISYEKKKINIGTNEQKTIDYISKKIKLIGDLNDEQKNRLLEISKKCPVHRTLESEIVIESTHITH